MAINNVNDSLIDRMELLKQYIGPYGIETPAQAIDRCIALMGGVEANCGNSASHSSANGSNGDNVAPPAPSEMLSLKAELFHKFLLACQGVRGAEIYDKAFEVLSPYLSPTKPVSLDLDKLVYAVIKEANNGIYLPGDEQPARALVKAVLDAGGVAYHD